MKRLAAVIAATAALAIVLPGAASAHDGKPFWTRVKAELTLATGNFGDAYIVACEGTGKGRKGAPSPLAALTKQYRHFMCVQLDLGLEQTFFRVHVMGRTGHKIQRLPNLHARVL